MINKIRENLIAARKEMKSQYIAAYSSVLSAVQEAHARQNQHLTADVILTLIEKETKAQCEIETLYKDKNASISKDASSRAFILGKMLPEKLDASQYPMIVDEAVFETKAESIRDMGK